MGIKKVLLKDIAMARAGDKANICNIGLMAKNEKVFNILKEKVTEEKVKDYFREFVKGSVKRYEMPNIYAFNFLLDDALDGGCQNSLRLDTLGKCFAPMLLKMEIDVEEEIIAGLST